MLNNSEMLEEYLIEAEDDGRLSFRKDLPLSSISTFRIGGNASFCIYPDSADELASLCALCRGFSIPFMVVGNASYLLFDDSGYEGAVIFSTGLNGIKIEGNELTAESGVSVTHLASVASRAGLSGLEFAYGIPGSVGGAVYMNAGAYGGEFKDVIKSVSYYDIEADEFCTCDLSGCRFGYRESSFQNGDRVILSMTVSLTPCDPDNAVRQMEEYMQRRKDKQPLDYPSAGSVFKRYPGYYTGQLIEEAGLKGFSIGGAQVSEKHAGFIINRENATCKDVLDLIAYVKDAIKSRVGIELNCEVKYIKNPAKVDTEN